jgi:hypothetical protein
MSVERISRTLRVPQRRAMSVDRISRPLRVLQRQAMNVERVGHAVENESHSFR